MAFNMNTQDSPVESQTSIDSEKKKQKKKKFHSIFQRSSRTPEIVMLNDEDNNTIPARTAAFATNEILHLILSNVSVNHYASIRRVSKTWNKVVTKIGYYITPINIQISAPNWPYQYPEYAATIPIVFNPIFGRGRPPKPTRPSREHYEARFQVDCLLYTRTLRKLGVQFLTNPPITHLALAAFPSVPGGASSMMIVRDGIRLRDLAAALDTFVKLNRGGDVSLFRKLGLSVAGLNQGDYEKWKGYSVGVHLFCVKGEGRREPEDLFIRVFGYGPERKTN
jgi:hypothetical protein